MIHGGHNDDAFNSQHDTYNGDLSGKFGTVYEEYGSEEYGSEEHGSDLFRKSV